MKCHRFRVAKRDSGIESRYRAVPGSPLIRSQFFNRDPFA
jgi:hypothetical protein